MSLVLDKTRPDFICVLDMIPVPKGRPRFSKFGKPYTPAKTREYEKAIFEALKLLCEEPVTGPVVLDVTFTFWRPKKPRHWLYPITRGGSTPGGADVDNYLKAVADSANTVLFVDDSQIVEIIGRKIYGDKASIEIMLWRLADVQHG